MAVTWPLVTRVAGTTATGGGTSTIGQFVATAANQIVVGIVYQSSGTVTSVTDTAGNSYTQCGSQVTDGGSNKIQLWRAWNITGNAANVVTIHLGSGTFSFCAITATQLTMTGTSDPLQGTSGTNGTGATASTGSVTVTGNAALIGIGVLNNGLITGGVPPTLHIPFYTVNGQSTSGQFLSSTFQLSSTSVNVQVSQGSASWGIIATAVGIPGAAGGGGTGGAWAYA